MESKFMETKDRSMNSMNRVLPEPFEVVFEAFSEREANPRTVSEWDNY